MIHNANQLQTDPTFSLGVYYLAPNLECYMGLDYSARDVYRAFLSK